MSRTEILKKIAFIKRMMVQEVQSFQHKVIERACSPCILIDDHIANMETKKDELNSLYQELEKAH